MTLPTFFECFNHPNIKITTDIPIDNTPQHTRLVQFSFHHDECTPDSESLVRHSRGLIFKNGEIVSRSLPYTPEIKEDDLNQLDKYINFETDLWISFKAYEGTIIRLVSINNTWFLCTQNQILSLTSSDTSLTKDFFNACGALKIPTNENRGIFLATLDPEYQYYFLLRPTSQLTRLVSQSVRPEESLIFLKKTFPTILTCELLDEKDSIYLNLIPKQTVYDIGCKENVQKILTGKENDLQNSSKYKEDIQKILNNSDYRDSQGIIIMNFSSEEFPFIKVLSKRYAHFSKVRGGPVDISFRYIQIRDNKTMIEDLYEIHPSAGDIFESIENIIDELANRLYDIYVKRYIYKNTLRVPKNEHLILKTCHEWHQQNRSENRVSKEKVYEVLTLLPPEELYRYICRNSNMIGTIKRNGY